MLRKLFSVLVLCAWCGTAGAQELNCKVVLLHEKITGVDNQVFVSMQRAISDFMNTHKWTTDEFTNAEKIDVNILINLTGQAGDQDTYGATINIQSSRPVYNTGYTSPMINYIDKDFVFKYSQFTPLDYDDNRVTGNDPMVSNLTAMLAYYAYMILGLDYDSFSPEGGTPYFKKAQALVLNAPEAKGITGWKAVDGTHNRYWLVDQLLNTRFQDVRSFWYTMHREGLDNMSAKPNDARTKILAGISKLNMVNKENPSSALMQFFFNSKGDELVKIVAMVPKQERGPYISMLASMDVPDAAKFNALR